MIKVGQIYKIDNDIGIVYNYDEKSPFIDVLFLEGLGVLSYEYFNKHSILLAEYPTLQEAVNSKEFKVEWKGFMMCKVLYINKIVPKKVFVDICKKYFGIVEMTSVAEQCRDIKNSLVFTDETDLICGNYGSGISLDNLKRHNDVVLLSTLIDDYNIGGLWHDSKDNWIQNC